MKTSDVKFNKEGKQIEEDPFWDEVRKRVADHNKGNEVPTILDHIGTRFDELIDTFNIPPEHIQTKGLAEHRRRVEERQKDDLWGISVIEIARLNNYAKGVLKEEQEEKDIYVHPFDEKDRNQANYLEGVLNEEFKGKNFLTKEEVENRMMEILTEREQIEKEILSNEYDYKALRDILNRAYEQAATGKGNERHGNGLMFEDQPMQLISELLSSEKGCLFQAMKKIQESTRLPEEQAVKELLGAIVYVAGAILYREMN